MSDLWYPVTPVHPAPLVQVRGIIEVQAQRSFDANLIVSRGKAPHENKWAEWIRGKPVQLAPHAIPKMWQPQHPDKWDAPLPAPLKTIESGRMWSATMRFTAVEDAEAAELAREMERDREMARDGGLCGKANKEGLAWWRDASLIRYEPVGSVTPRMAEGRVMRAVACCGHGQGLTIKSNSFGKILADIAAAGAQEAYATSDYVPRLRPLPQDHQDFETAMAWFVALDPPELRHGRRKRYATWDFNRLQMAIILRSLDVPISYEAIGTRQEFEMTAEGVRKLVKSAMVRVTKVANGLSAYDHIAPASAQIDALRERNLAAKRVA